MPAPRTCRRCGELLSPDVPWCGRCSEPVRQFAARPPLHDEHSFVGTPSHVRTAGGHYTRWEKTATTFGPTGRVGWTIGLVGYLILEASSTFFLLWFVQLFIAGWLLKEIWKRGWAVTPSSEQRPGSAHREADPPPLRTPPTEAPSEPAIERQLELGTIVGRGLIIVCAAAGLAVFLWGSQDAKGGVAMTAGLVALYALFRWAVS
jgi:hypothetical protein